MLSQSKSRVLLAGFIRQLTLSSPLTANHYDELEITPKATQSDIKTAYYKLSKIYHPDKSNDEKSAKKFRAITEAYEILGNVKLKKMYDKGLLVGRENTSRMDYEPEPEPTDPTLKFYKSRTYRHITPTMSGKTPVYDFESWSKQHYGDVFKKSQYERDYIRTKKNKLTYKTTQSRQEAVIYFIFLICGLFTCLVLQGRSDYDANKLSDQKIQTEPPKH